MIRFDTKFKGGKEICDISINDILRFHCSERGSFSGGWDLYTLHFEKHIGWFQTLASIETYVKEMDK